MVSERPVRICIIGGGAGGLSTLKVLLEAKEYRAGLWELALFEAREQVGGAWLPSPPHGDPPASPVYDALTTNLPHPVMAFQSHWFPPSTPLFPHASAVLAYIESYAEKFNLLKFIRFGIRVDEAVWNGHSWDVRLSDGTAQHFDRVVVANGHYHIPRYPDIPGLARWLDSGMATHSVFYRNAQPYGEKTVLVIGNGPSGQDISAEISTVAATLYRSILGSPSEDVGKVKLRGKVVRYGEPGTVVFEDGSSASGIDYAILATGYVMSFPFLPQIRQGPLPNVPPLPSHILNTTYSVFPLAKHIFPLWQDDIPPESVAFVGLIIRSAPFPLFEAQGRFISRVFGQPGSLDSASEVPQILARYNKLHEQWGDNPTVLARQWHIVAELEQFSYRRELLEFAEAEEWNPEDWAEEMYCAKRELRKAWIELERNGQGDEWVQGVGEGGRHEWVALMRRLLEFQASKIK